MGVWNPSKLNQHACESAARKSSSSASTFPFNCAASPRLHNIIFMLRTVSLFLYADKQSSLLKEHNFMWYNRWKRTFDSIKIRNLQSFSLSSKTFSITFIHMLLCSTLHAHIQSLIWIHFLPSSYLFPLVDLMFCVLLWNEKIAKFPASFLTFSNFNWNKIDNCTESWNITSHMKCFRRKGCTDCTRTQSAVVYELTEKASNTRLIATMILEWTRRTQGDFTHKWNV